LKYKGYIFDLDGVLIDSSRIHYNGWKEVLRALGKDVDYETFRTTFFGKRGVDTLESLFGKGRFKAEEVRHLSDEIDSNFVKTVAEVGLPIPGALDFVRGLKAAGQKVALGTSAPRQNVDAFLEAFSLRGIFDSEVCGDDVTHGKPNPEVFLKAAAGLGEAPGDCVVFEDSLPGVTSAKAAGTVCVALLTTTTRETLGKADFFIKDFLDDTLKRIIRPEEPVGSKLREKV
jgi:HAD superfamily hydrolase (TIGR01509 family)